MKIGIYNKAINFFLIYGLLLILVLSVFNADVVANMAYIVMLYGPPLLIFIVLYFVTAGIEIYQYQKEHKANFVLLTKITIKIIVAVSPMFFLNNHMANIMAALNATA